MGKLYQISDWDAHYENNKSRERKECSYVCIPNSQSGLGFSRIMAQKDGAAIYGIWCLLLGSLSRQKRINDKGRNGWLTDDGHQTGTPWQASDLALVWRRQASEIQRALDFLSSPAMGWIVSTESNDSSIVMRAGHHTGTECPPSALERIEEKRNEEKARAPNSNLVSTYCEQLGLPCSDGVYLWEKWEANDWMNHREKIKDWRGTIRAWKAANYLPSQKKNSGQVKPEILSFGVPEPVE